MTRLNCISKWIKRRPIPVRIQTDIYVNKNSYISYQQTIADKLYNLVINRWNASVLLHKFKGAIMSYKKYEINNLSPSLRVLLF